MLPHIYNLCNAILFDIKIPFLYAGQTYVLGRKEYGRLGLGENCDDATEPTLIPALKDKKVINISCGSCVSFAVTEEGIYQVFRYLGMRPKILQFV